jgi:hypothetical protein
MRWFVVTYDPPFLVDSGFPVSLCTLHFTPWEAPGGGAGRSSAARGLELRIEELADRPAPV